MTLRCPRCQHGLDPARFGGPGLAPCPTCGARLQARVFPALFRAQATSAADPTFLFEDDAVCFYHPRKKAVIPCGSCGRFLCSLCDVEFGGQHICPACLDRGEKKHTIQDLIKERRLFDNLALGLALLPMIFVWPTLVTAPLAIYVTIRYWKAPSSIIPRTKIRFIAASIVATLQLAGWVAFFSNVL